jgi:cyclic pyranopterin phosphate synthase
MRDVSAKSNSLRSATAQAILAVSPSTIKAVRSGNLPKVDPLAVARVAGIQAAKNTSTLIPYCHQAPLDFVGVDFELNADSIRVTTHVKAIWKTGVEMEALVAASIASMTLYDMLKPIDDAMVVHSIQLLEKTGGVSSMKETGSGLVAAVVVVSDSVSQGKAEDVSGKVLRERLVRFDLEVARYNIVPDERALIETELRELVDHHHIDIVVTTGGTGVGPRDVTPEATLAVIDRRLEGIEETLRRYGQDRALRAMLSRGVVGFRSRTLIVNLPGSPRAVKEGVDAIFPAVLHAFNAMRGDAH